MRALIPVVTCTLLLVACAGFQPDPEGASTFKQRAISETMGPLTVRVSVPGAEESRRIFDADLYREGIQPVWIEVQNDGDERAWYLPVGTDSEYFVPHEVAWKLRGGRSSRARTEMEAFLRNSAMSRHVPAGETVSGFVFTHLSSGTKGINIDLIDDQFELSAFTFYVDVPGLRADHRDIDPESIYGAGFVADTATPDELYEALVELSCCSIDPSVDLPDFVLNLVVIGETDQFHHALIKGRWEEAPIDIAGNSPRVDEDYAKYFDTRPVVPMYFQDRIQDAVFVKSRPSVGESNQVNLWLTAIKYRGLPVWVGQTARVLVPRRGGGSLEQTEPHLDEARFFFIQNLLYSGSLDSYGFAPAIEPITFAMYQQATDGTEYFTDGQRAVIWLSEDYVPYNHVEYVELSR